MILYLKNVNFSDDSLVKSSNSLYQEEKYSSTARVDKISGKKKLSNKLQLFFKFHVFFWFFC